MKRVNLTRTIHITGFLVVLSAVVMPSFSFAQEGDADETYGKTQLEEITVTARKRVESLQDVALSVSAMGQQEIKNTFATDIRDLVYISPNTVLDDTHQGPGGVAAAYIRGVGVSEVEKNFDPAVGVVVDGIFRGSMSGSIARSIDLERIEVLRGPQGTLFGRNTIGGVINMERSRPTMGNTGKVRVGYGNYETWVVDGIINFGNGENFGVKLGAAYRDQGKGYFQNLNSGNHEGFQEYKMGSINVLWAPTDGLELEWTYVDEQTDQDSPPLLYAGQPGQLFCDAFGWCAPDTETPISGGRYLTLRDCGDTATHVFPTDDFVPPGYNAPTDCDNATFDAITNQLEARWDFNENYRLDFIGGVWKTDETAVNDWDAVNDVLFHTNRPAEYDQTTFELRLTYDAGDKLVYTVGGYYWDSEYTQVLNSYIGFVVPGVVLDIPQLTVQTSKSKALFFEGDYSFNDKWTLTLGGRWTEDKKTTDQSGAQANVVNDAKWNDFTPKAALKYDATDRVMLYGLFSTGYRAGGFNGRVDSDETAFIPYDPETVDNFELGIRTESVDGTFILNATAFHMDYKDKQEEIQQPSETSGTGQVTRVVNASSATIKGLEFEVMWLVSEGFTVRANLGLLDAGYDEFLINTGTTDEPVITDFSDLDFRRAPEINYGIDGTYEWQLNTGSMMARLGIRHIGAHEVDFFNKPELHNDSQNLVDASINYYYGDWYASVWGRNLSGEDGYQIGFDVAGLWSYAAPRPPKTYGIEVGYRWGN